MATHSSTLAYKIPWTEEPGWLQSMGSHRVGHDAHVLAKDSEFLLFLHFKSLPYSVLTWDPFPA